MRTVNKLWVGIAILALLTPLGMLAKGVAWGEWDTQQLAQSVGFCPAGLARLSSLWSAFLGDYALPGWQKPWQAALGYFLCAIAGGGIAALLCLVLGKIFVVRKDGCRHGH